MKTLLHDFTDPGAAYRGKPFWSWNGALDRDELRRQVHVMKEMGLGGFFIHSRLGLSTRYLGPEWFSLVSAMVEEARQLGLEAWLYDEDRWPSGAAGGLVTRDDRFRKRMLFMDRLNDPAALGWTDHVLAVFTARLDGSRASDLRRVPAGTTPRRLAPGRTLLVFRWEIDDPSDWFNGGGYLDTLNPAAVHRFIETTHEAYRAQVGGQFGGVIPGIFTDETSRGGMGTIWKGSYHGPWTEALPAFFRQRYGYDLLPHLPELFFDVEGRSMTPARLHYHDSVTALFVNAFARQIGDWCTANHLMLTGHWLAEETLSSQTSTVGSCMRLYEPMEAPGIDILTEQTRHIATAKQCVSVARQCGRRWRLTETYGACGWAFTFAGNKAVGDWQLAMGINLRCQHLAYYTLEGEAKRDYPGTFSFQAPWWRQYTVVEDYFARAHAVMTRGEEVRDLLVIHPIESMWAQCKAGWNEAPETRAYDRMQIELENGLLAQHLDFDYGDEEMLARLGRVRRRQGQACLHVGQAAYTTVLVPPLKTMRRSTLRLLQRFRAAGGKVVFAGEMPAYLDARPSTAIQAFAAAGDSVALTEAALATGLGSSRRISLVNPQGEELGSLLYLLRQDADAYYLFICNTGVDLRTRSDAWLNDPPVETRQVTHAEVTIRGLPDAEGVPQEFDPTSGAVYTAEARRTATGWEMHTHFDRLESRIFVVPRSAAAAPFPKRPVFRDVRRDLLSPTGWSIHRDEPNVLVLDRAQWQIGEGPRQETDYILRIDRQVRKTFDLPPRSNGMIQPWAEDQGPRGTPTTVRLDYTFTVSHLPQGSLRLALERPETAQVTLNGTPVTVAPAGWWLDPAFKTLDLDPALLQQGNNTLVVTYTYDARHTGLEACYLLGEFGVRVDGAQATLIEAPTELSVGDWTSAGFPFYGGNLTYETTVTCPAKSGERLFLRVPRFAGTALRVAVNGRTAGLLAWAPYEVDLTEFLAECPSRLQIEVLGHRHNVLGPLHSPGGQGANPEMFCTEGANWRDAYQLTPLGLLAPPELVTRVVDGGT